MGALIRLVLLLAIMAGTTSARAESAAGNAVEVVPQAQGNLSGTTVALASGDDLFMGQQVITGNAGRVQVVFSDQTHLVVGPGSSLVIAQYLMRNNGTASKFVVNALGGTFRFITGNSPKNAYQINTPTGTLGVRGTAFDFGIDKKSGDTQVLLYHGGVRMCGADGSCVMLTEACSVGVIPHHDAASVYGKSDHRRPPMLKNFPYLASQAPLEADFRVGGSGGCKEQPLDVTDPIKAVFDLRTPPAPIVTPVSTPIVTPPVVVPPVIVPPVDPGCPDGDQHHHKKSWVHDGNCDHDQGFGNNEAGPLLQTEPPSPQVQTLSVASTSGSSDGGGSDHGQGQGNGGGNGDGNNGSHGNDNGHGNDGGGGQGNGGNGGDSGHDNAGSNGNGGGSDNAGGNDKSHGNGADGHQDKGRN
jgi:hypothetical protein